MPSSAHFKQLVERCNHIASEISDYDGFVSIQKLVARFDAKLFIRPLLVEGMIASSESDNGGKDGNGHKWVLFVDSERYPVSDKEIAMESFGSPLPVRFRNTVAHELAHSLASRATEFGVKFPKQFSSEKSRREFIRGIEMETEALSPLLLIPNISLDRFFAPEKEKIDIQELADFQKSLGVSRPVFVNRLNLLRVSDDRRLRVHRQGLRNMAIGIGEWKSEGEAVLKEHPLYSFFEGGKVPSFIFQLQRRIDISAKKIFSDMEFALCGGRKNYTECIVPAGTPKTPNSIQLPIRCSVENIRKKTGPFLFAIQLRD
jgi:hypothetical protein